MARGIGCAGFVDEVGDLGEDRGVQVGVGWIVGDYVDVVLGRDVGGERELVEVFAGNDGRVLKLLDVGRFKLRCSANFRVWVVRVDRRERGADAPARGDDHGRLDRNLRDGNVRRIDHRPLPLEYGDFVGGTSGAHFDVSVQRRHTGGDVEVELEHVDVVATPGKRLSVGGEDQVEQVGDGAVGSVVAGDPLGHRERKMAGLDRDVALGRVDFAAHLGEVGGDADGLLGGHLQSDEGGGDQDDLAKHWGVRSSQKLGYGKDTPEKAGKTHGFRKDAEERYNRAQGEPMPIPVSYTHL